MRAYSATASVLGSPESALQSALTTLTHCGFRILHRESSSVTLEGPGLNSTRQNPLLGASVVHLRADADRIDLQAELGGVERMTKFLYRFPLGLGIGLGLVFGVIAMLVGQSIGNVFDLPGWMQGWRIALVAMPLALLPVTPWIIISPLMSQMILRRTERALETLLHNAKHH